MNADLEHKAAVVAEWLLGWRQLDFNDNDWGLRPADAHPDNDFFPGISWLTTGEGMLSILEALKEKGHRRFLFEWDFQTDKWWATIGDESGYAPDLPGAVLEAAYAALEDK